MKLETGQKLGPYEIIEQAGAGGMGEVYKARDTRLERIVAIKILPESVASKPDFKERFEREAKAISSLNHANICTLYDVGKQDGFDFLVMEFLEGETLAERLMNGPLPYDELLRIAVDISAGLDSAHQQGLIHRDLKPGNVMLTRDGAKLMDFGLAKLQLESEAIQGMTAITQTTPLTGAGTILGTMQYMAPEQLEGLEADARSDIFAFGGILYEMSTGKRAFEGKSNATLIAAIIEREPTPLSVVMPRTPPLFERLVKKCLSKDPQARWQSAADLSDEIRWLSQAGSQAGIPAHLAARRKFKFDLARAIGAATILTTLALAYLLYAEKTKLGPEQPVARYTVNIKQGLVNIFWPRISPDGRSIAFHADDSLGTNRIWIRPVNSLEAYPLLNTENARRFFWSPDSRHVAFFIRNQLKRIPISGGQAQLICQGPTGADGSWGSSDLILFDGSTGDTMKVVPAGGGLARPATLVDSASGELTHSWPWFLPDGKHFLFTTRVRRAEGNDGAGVRLKLGNIDSTSSITLYDLSEVDRIEYSREGYILFVSQDNLMVLPFDAEKLEVTGEPKPIAMKIGTADNTYAFSVTDDGTLLYQTNNQASLSELVWVDRAGKRIETVGQQGRYFDLQISPDETKLVYTSISDAASASDIWVYDLRRNVPTRLTFDPGLDNRPTWSPDGEFVYFGSLRNGQFFGIYRKAANGLGEVELVYNTDSSHHTPQSFTPDGKKLIMTMVNDNWDIGILHLDDSNRVDMLANSSFFEAFGTVSPSGEYVAYVSRESGQREVYVRKLDGSGGKWQISTENGMNPLWRQDGRELFYLTSNDKIMAVEVTAEGDFKAENPVELFEAHFQYPGLISRPFDCSDDGQKFLINVKIEKTDPGEIVVVQNWAEEFK